MTKIPLSASKLDLPKESEEKNNKTTTLGELVVELIPPQPSPLQTTPDQGCGISGLKTMPGVSNGIAAELAEKSKKYPAFRTGGTLTIQPTAAIEGKWRKDRKDKPDTAVVLTCHGCHQEGHKARACPTSPQCGNCYRAGHTSENCRTPPRPPCTTCNKVHKPPCRYATKIPSRQQDASPNPKILPTDTQIETKPDSEGESETETSTVEEKQACLQHVSIGDEEEKLSVGTDSNKPAKDTAKQILAGGTATTKPAEIATKREKPEVGPDNKTFCTIRPLAHNDQMIMKTTTKKISPMTFALIITTIELLILAEWLCAEVGAVVWPRVLCAVVFFLAIVLVLHYATVPNRWVMVQHVKHHGADVQTLERPSEHDKVTEKLLAPKERLASVTRGWLLLTEKDCLRNMSSSVGVSVVNWESYIDEPISEFLDLDLRPDAKWYDAGRWKAMFNWKTYTMHITHGPKVVPACSTTMNYSLELLAQHLNAKNTCYSQSKAEMRTKLSLAARGKPLVWTDRWQKTIGTDIHVGTSHMAEHLIAVASLKVPKLEEAF